MKNILSVALLALSACASTERAVQFRDTKDRTDEARAAINQSCHAYANDKEMYGSPYELLVDCMKRQGFVFEYTPES